MPSKDVMLKFKRKVIKRIMFTQSEEKIEEERGMWNNFFLLLENIF